MQSDNQDALQCAEKRDMVDGGGGRSRMISVVDLGKDLEHTRATK